MIRHEDLSWPTILDMAEWRKLRRQFGGKPGRDNYGYSRYATWIRSLSPVDHPYIDQAQVQQNITWFKEEWGDG